MNALEQYAVKRALDKVREATGGESSEFASLPTSICGGDSSYPARVWAEQHPDDFRGCCEGDAIYGPERCTCWTPVYAVEQQPPRPDYVQAQTSMCGDCAFRPGSPERDGSLVEEALYESVRGGTPFWCHSGMRRPLKWMHPDGSEVEGSPDDWAPPIVGSMPYQADGSPALLCAGAVAVARKALCDTEREDDQEA